MDVTSQFISSITESGLSEQDSNNRERYHQSFAGIGRLIGKNTYLTLASKHVMIIGVGGVGSWTAESIVRSGIGEVTLVDLDDVCVSNINRQLPALIDNVGQQKIDVLKERLQKINPDVKVNLIGDFYTEASADEILSFNPDIVVDAIDSLAHKCHLISKCLEKNIPLVVCGAAGGRLDPTQIRSSDLMKTTRDKLLKTLRQKLKKKYGIDTGGKEVGVYAVYSEELPVYPTSDGEVCSKPSIATYGLDCKGGMGSSSFVTGSFGMAASSVVIKHFMKKNTALN